MLLSQKWVSELILVLVLDNFFYEFLLLHPAPLCLGDTPPSLHNKFGSNAPLLRSNSTLAPLLTINFTEGKGGAPSLREGFIRKKKKLWIFTTWPIYFENLDNFHLNIDFFLSSLGFQGRIFFNLHKMFFGSWS